MSPMGNLKEQVRIKLEKKGLSGLSSDEEIKKALEATASPKFCFKAAMLLREDLNA